MPDQAVTDQLEYTETELLESHAFGEPLIAGGVRCHGGFDDDGHYISPRTRHRVPAISDGKRPMPGSSIRRCSTFRSRRGPSTTPTSSRRDTSSGERDRAARRDADSHRHRRGLRRQHPLLRARQHAAPSSTKTSRAAPSITSAAGSYEAHGRDEAGWEEEGGHKDMWFAARDVAFESPTPRSTSS